MSQVETKLREAIKGLLDDGKVDLVIGHEAGSLPLRSRPVFIRDAAEAERLVWGPTCANNLAVYLPRVFARPTNPRQEYAPPTVGIVAKGCDARSVIGLIKEHQLPRDKVVIIGVPCTGMIDARKAEDALDGARIISATEDGDIVRVETSAGEKTLKLADLLADGCSECSHPSAPEADVVIEGVARPVADIRFERVAAFEAMAAEKPIITSDSGALPEVVGDAGVVIEDINANKLKSEIQRLHNDPGERQELGKIGKKRSEMFKPEHIAKQVIDRYYHVLKNVK